MANQIRINAEYSNIEDSSYQLDDKSNQTALLSKTQSSDTQKLQELKKDQQQSKPKERLLCLDVFRGLTMVGMILVDSMGNFSYVIWPLNETEWNGLSTADCVFPSFLFIGGMAVVLAINLQRDRKDIAVWKRLIKRTLILFFIGELLNFQSRIPRIFTTSPFVGWRIMGVLQRIALCYFTITSLYLTTNNNLYIQFSFIGACIAVYLGFMYGYDVPGCGKGEITPQCNFGAYLDGLIFGKKYMFRTFDPEGVFTTLSAFINYFLGLCFSLVMKTYKSNKQTLLKFWIFFTALLLFIGGIFSVFNPVNKKIWSISFAFITSGISGAGLTLCYYLIDILDIKIIKQKIILPFIWLGMNPLFVFVMMIFFDNILMNNITFQYGDIKKYSLWNFINNQIFNSWINYQYISSLLVSILNLCLWLFIAYMLFKRNIFIKL